MVHIRTPFITALAMSLFIGGADEPKGEPGKEKKEQRVFKTWQEIYREVPADQRPAELSKMTEVQRDAMNETLANTVSGEPAQMKIKVDKVETSTLPRFKGMLQAQSVPDRFQGANVYVTFYFYPKDKGEVAKIQKGQTISASGKISIAEFFTGKEPRFVVRVTDPVLSTDKK
jgi:hypothetical protein